MDFILDILKNGDFTYLGLWSDILQIFLLIILKLIEWRKGDNRLRSGYQRG